VQPQPIFFGEWTKYPDNPILQKPGNLVGVGHSAMFVDKQRDLRIVFHAHYDQKNIHPRKMCIGRAGFKKGMEWISCILKKI